MEEFVHRSLENSGFQYFDLMQLHTWLNLAQGDDGRQFSYLR